MSKKPPAVKDSVQSRKTQAALSKKAVREGKRAPDAQATRELHVHDEIVMNDISPDAVDAITRTYGVSPAANTIANLAAMQATIYGAGIARIDSQVSSNINLEMDAAFERSQRRYSAMMLNPFALSEREPPRTATEIRERELERSSRQHVPRGDVEVRLDRRPDLNSYVASVRVREMGMSHAVPNEVVQNPDEQDRFCREMALRTAREMTNRIERQVYEQAMRMIQRDRMERYGPRGEVDERLAHWGDMYRYVREGNWGGSSAEPTDKVHAAFAPLPKEIEAHGYKAELIDNTIKLKAEGDEMSHCIGYAYRDRVANGKYVAYHVSGHNLPKSGLTLGYHFDKEIRYDQLKGKRNDTHHCRSPEILSFVEYATRQLLNATGATKCATEKDEVNTTASRVGIVQMDLGAGAVNQIQPRHLVQVTTLDEANLEPRPLSRMAERMARFMQRNPVTNLNE